MGTASSAADQEVDNFPPPRYDASLWMASCRPVSSTRRFSKSTLLFQPDCRVFCLNGPNCRLLHGPHGQVHREHFIHTTGAAIRASAVRDQQYNPRTVVVNNAGANVSVPHVRQCWSVGFSDGEERAVLLDSLTRKTVIVWVHGFRQKFYPVVNIGNHLRHRFDSAEIPVRPSVVTFLWPAYGHFWEYKSARSNAALAATRLTILLQMLRDHDCRITVVGHSMGCRVALAALAQESASVAARNRDLCKHLVLIAAAVASDSLSDVGEFPRDRIAAEQLSVVSSQRDDVLRDFFPKGEALFGSLTGLSRTPVALGFSGPALPLPPDVFHFDASDEVGNHGPNVAIASPAVMRCISNAADLPISDAASSADGFDDIWSIASADYLADDQTMSLEDDAEEGELDAQLA
eukprot:TRINITY_DN59064_c0_g1_i1.p1 TRINITY_DN59064_c0_g1~~TRINITY_DN59064_c0_g1_i1.p1  ORF type:complete len:405 (-),score=41.88 TRINITY_DN59064_c0_g1_i1:32-1246(-)